MRIKCNECGQKLSALKWWPVHLRNVHPVHAGITYTQLDQKVDPLVRATKKAFANSDPGKLQKLLDEESRWKRKLTIAQNKLADARQAVTDYAKEMADRLVKGESK